MVALQRLPTGKPLIHEGAGTGAKITIPEFDQPCLVAVLFRIDGQIITGRTQDFRVAKALGGHLPLHRGKSRRVGRFVLPLHLATQQKKGSHIAPLGNSHWH